MENVTLALTVAGVVAALGALIPNKNSTLRIATAAAGTLLLGIAAVLYFIDKNPRSTGDINEGGSKVQSCRRFSGKVKLPSNKTIVLTNKNLSNKDLHRYARLPIGWDRPEKLDEWNAVQYFGIGDDNMGQKFQIELIAVNLDEVQKYQEAFRDPGGLSGEETDKLIEDGDHTILDEVYVVRIKGNTPDSCQE